MQKSKKVLKLMLILSDYLNNIVYKGEVVEKYYNPGDYFDEVHILMIHDDKIIEDSFEFLAVQRMVGTAKLYLYNLPKPDFVRSFGWRHPKIMQRWCASGLALAQQIQPDIIRTYNNYLDGYLAYYISKEKNIPYVISLHDSTRFVIQEYSFSEYVQQYGLKKYILERIFRFFMHRFEVVSLQHASCNIAVYKSIYKYAVQYAPMHTKLLYNCVASSVISPKKDYRAKCVHFLTVNRQMPGKDPSNIIRAIKDLDCEYTLIGDGEYHQQLIQLASELGCEKKIHFIKSLDNLEICRSLWRYDVFIIHNDYLGISKGVIEASFAGLPIIVNYNRDMSDFDGEWALICDGTERGYHGAIHKLFTSEKMRREYGHKALDHATQYFNSEEIKQKLIGIYQNLTL